MKRYKLQFLAAIALTIGAIVAFSISGKAGGLQIDQPFAPASIGAGKTGAIYFVLINGTGTDEKLIAASTPAARKAEVHTHLMEDGIMKMRKVDGLEVPAGKHVMFKQGGHHLMLFGLDKPLKEGDTIVVELQFENTGTMSITVPVKPFGHKMMDHKSMDHSTSQ